MSHYDEVLKEARAKASGSAKEYIPRLYHILVDEENKTAEDARAIIEHDLIEYWAKTTVRKYLPQEAKDEIKQEAGKKGAEKKKIMLLADGSRADNILAETQTVTKEADDTIPADKEDPVKIENEFLKEKVTELEDALRKTDQFKPATAFEVEKDMKAEPHIKNMGFEFLREAADGIHSFYYDAYGIDLFKNRELSQLKNSGVKVFRRLYFEV